jgi:hypothetical protein
MGDEVETTVFCHSGYTYAQRPLAFLYHEERLEVDTVEAEWVLPEGRTFLVTTSDERRFKLFYEQTGDRWLIVPT